MPPFSCSRPTAKSFADAAPGILPLAPHRSVLPGRDGRFFAAGALAALGATAMLWWASHLPLTRRIVRQFVWWAPEEGSTAGADRSRPPSPEPTSLVLYQENAEAVEWVNMCMRKVSEREGVWGGGCRTARIAADAPASLAPSFQAWRVYQRGLERWFASLLQPVFDGLVADGQVPRFVQRLRILEFTLDHEAPSFSSMRRRTSRKDSDLNGVVALRYTGGARMLLMLEVGSGRWRVKVPVLVSDLDVECAAWMKVRLAPMCPYVGTLSLAFVAPPDVKVQLSPYNRVRLMRIPVLQAYLTRLFTVDLPGLMVLPRRLEINIPPAVTAVAEAAVGRDAVMRAVATAVLQADALENALAAALPLGPQSAAGGVSLPDSFVGELQVTLAEARDLPVWGFPWQSNPYCRVTLGSQAIRSRRDDATSHAGRHRAPVWNQEFQLLVEDPASQTLNIEIRDSHITGRPDVGRVDYALASMPRGGEVTLWLPVRAPPGSGARDEGQLQVILVYKPFEDDEDDGGYREARAVADSAGGAARGAGITDVKSAADASSRAAVAASAAAAAVAVTNAAAARAATKAARAARAARAAAVGGVVVVGPPAAPAAPSATQSWASSSSDEDGGDAPPPAAATAATADDLFPGVAFRISDAADEDAPYEFGSAPPPRAPGRTITVPRGAGASPSAVAAADAEAARAAAALLRAGAGDTLSLADAPETADAAVNAVLGSIEAGAAGAGADGGAPPALVAALTPTAAGPPARGLSYVGHADEDLKDVRPPLLLPERGVGAGSDGAAAAAAASDPSPPPPPSGAVATAKAWAGNATSSARGWAGAAAAAVGGGAAAVGGWWADRTRAAPAPPTPPPPGPDDPLSDIIVPADLPLDAIAEEVRGAWKLKEVRAEALVRRAVERSEKPWLILLSVLTASSAVLFLAVLWKLTAGDSGGGGGG